MMAQNDSPPDDAERGGGATELGTDAAITIAAAVLAGTVRPQELAGLLPPAPRIDTSQFAVGPPSYRRRLAACWQVAVARVAAVALGRASAVSTTAAGRQNQRSCPQRVEVPAPARHDPAPAAP